MDDDRTAWKEGRHGAASLCYIRPTEDQLALLSAQHARVGIRAMLAPRQASERLAELAERKWDLASGCGLGPERLPVGDRRSLVVDLGGSAAAEPSDGCLVVGTADAPLAGPGPYRSGILPSLRAPEDPQAAKAAIRAVADQGGWGIWRIDARILSTWGESGVAMLLTWLGDEHARIWCAPVSDIAAWQG